MIRIETNLLERVSNLLDGEELIGAKTSAKVVRWILKDFFKRQTTLPEFNPDAVKTTPQLQIPREKPIGLAEGTGVYNHCDVFTVDEFTRDQLIEFSDRRRWQDALNDILIERMAKDEQQANNHFKGLS